MRTLAACLPVAFLIGCGQAAGSPNDTDRALLTVARPAPLVLKGSGFEPRERVRITVTFGAKRFSKWLTAGARGGFAVSFSTVTYDRCGGLDARAVGEEGSRAALKPRAQTYCPPRL